MKIDTFSLESALYTAAQSLKGNFGAREGKLFASDLGQVRDDGGCTRGFWYKLRNEPTKALQKDRVMKMLMGDYLEEMVVALLTRELPIYGYRVTDTQGYAGYRGIPGKVDIIAEHLESRDEILFEVKATSSKSERFLPKKGHMLQTQMYMESRGIDQGSLVYFFYDTGEFRVFPVTRNRDEVDSAINDLRALAEGPEPPPASKPWQKQYCDLKRCRCQ